MCVCACAGTSPPLCLTVYPSCLALQSLSCRPTQTLRSAWELHMTHRLCPKPNPLRKQRPRPCPNALLTTRMGLCPRPAALKSRWVFWVLGECNMSHFLSHFLFLSMIVLQHQCTEVSSAAHCSLQDRAYEGLGLTLHWEVKGHTRGQQFTCCCKQCTCRQVTDDTARFVFIKVLECLVFFF